MMKRRAGFRSAAPQGFTLLEVLLAMAITALVAVMAYAGLSAAISAAERHGGQVQRLGEVQTALSWLVRDLRQSVDRSVLDGRGDDSPALVGSAENEVRLELTRIGWDNPRGQRRGSVQRVRYRLDANGDLWREHWLVLDRLDDEDGLQSVKLLSGVERLTLQYLDGKSARAEEEALGGEWVEAWPATPGDRLLPLAVQIDVELRGLGAVRRVVGMANAQP